MEKKVKMNAGATRGTPEQGQRAYEYQQEIKKEHEERMKYIEEQLSDNRGRMGRD